MLLLVLICCSLFILVVVVLILIMPLLQRLILRLVVIAALGFDVDCDFAFALANVFQMPCCMLNARLILMLPLCF